MIANLFFNFIFLMKTTCQHPKLRIALIIWLVFTTLYVLYGEYNRLNNFVAKGAYQRGLADAVTQVLKQSQKCEPFPVNIGDQGVQLINLKCVQQASVPEGGAE